ncbi:MAG: hypothetical protein WCJ97_01645 [Phycisphaerae bacterium]
MRVTLIGGCLIALLLPLSACSGSKKRFPEPLTGWHNADYSIVMGRVQRLPGATPEEPTRWYLFYTNPQDDGYKGRFALRPAERMIGFIGGELIKVTGRPTTERDAASGLNFYDVYTVKLWSNLDRE